MLLAGYLTLIGTVFVVFFHTDYNRQRANRERLLEMEQSKKMDEEETSSSSSGMGSSD